MRAPQRPMDHIREEAARWLASREEAGLMPSTARRTGKKKPPGAES